MRTMETWIRRRNSNKHSKGDAYVEDSETLRYLRLVGRSCIDHDVRRGRLEVRGNSPLPDSAGADVRRRHTESQAAYHRGLYVGAVCIPAHWNRYPEPGANVGFGIYRNIAASHLETKAPPKTTAGSFQRSSD